MICDRLEECIETELMDAKQDKCRNHDRNRCIASSDCRSRPKCEERGKKYVLDNTANRHVLVMKMDGGIIVEDKTVPEKTGKCDYLYIVGKEKEYAILVELKGVDVRKTINQIRGALVLYKEVFKKFEHTFARIIVASSTPDLKASPEYVKLATDIARCGGNLKVFERQCVEKDIDLGR